MSEALRRPSGHLASTLLLQRILAQKFCCQIFEFFNTINRNRTFAAT